MREQGRILEAAGIGDEVADATLFAKIAVAVTAALLFGWRVISMSRHERHSKDHMLDSFLPELRSTRSERTTWRYPTLSGQFDNVPVRVDLFPDTLVVRALPTLYLEVRWVQRSEGRLRVIVDPVGTEYFADDADLPLRLPPPPPWPKSVEVRGSGNESKVLLRRLEALPLGDYPLLRQIALSEDEAKVTLRCARGERLTYRVLRSASFAPDSVSPEVVSQALSLTRFVRQALGADGAQQL